MTDQQSTPLSAEDRWRETARQYAENTNYWRERAERCEADAARERPSALDVETHRAAYCRVMHPGQHDDGPYCVNRLGDAIAAEYARLTEPDAGEGPVGPVRIRSANCRAGDHGDCLGMVEQDVPGLGITDCLCDCHPMPASTPDTTEATPEQTHSAEFNRGWAAGQASALDATQPVIDRLQRALRVANHRPHDRDGEPNEGFPTCSGCGAILTGPDTTGRGCTCDGYGGHARGCDCHIDPEMDPTVCDSCTGKSEQERASPDASVQPECECGCGYPNSGPYVRRASAQPEGGPG